MIRPALLVLLGGSALIGLAALALGQTVTPPSGGSGGATSFTLGSTSIPVPGTTTTVTGLTLSGTTFTGTTTIPGVGTIDSSGNIRAASFQPIVQTAIFGLRGNGATDSTGIMDLMINSSSVMHMTNGSVVFGFGQGGASARNGSTITLDSNINATNSMTFANKNNSTAAQAGWYLGNDTADGYASMLLNGSGNSSGNGANSLTWTTTGSLFIGTGGTNSVSIDSTGHLNLSGKAAPSIASGACGTGTNGTITGSDQSGVITVGAVATTACAVTFGSTWAVAPKSCVFSAANAGAVGATVLPFISAISQTGFTLSGTALASTSFGFQCL